MRARPEMSAMSLVFFTVLTQGAAGVAVATSLAPARERTLTALALLGLGTVAAVLHLGRHGNARFALANARSSWLSREGMFVVAFGVSLVAAAASPETPFLDVAAALLGVALVGAISMVYLVRTIPPWNTWMTPASFFLTMIVVGAALSSTTLTTEWNGWGLIHLAAAAAVAQAGLAALHKLRYRATTALLPVFFQALVVAGGIACLLGLSRRGVAMAAPALILAELVGRYAFYASHRRVGL